MDAHSSILAWKTPMVRGAWWATVHGVTKSDMTEPLTLTYLFTWDKTTSLSGLILLRNFGGKEVPVWHKDNSILMRCLLDLSAEDVFDELFKLAPEKVNAVKEVERSKFQECLLPPARPLPTCPGSGGEGRAKGEEYGPLALTLQLLRQLPRSGGGGGLSVTPSRKVANLSWGPGASVLP